MTDLINPMLDDDEEDYPAVHAQPARPAFRIERPVAEPTAPVTLQRTKEEPAAPVFGQRGFRKGMPNPHKGSPRARVTEATAPILAQVAKFPASTAEAASMVSLTQPSKAKDYEGGKLRTVEGTMKILRKFQRLGLVESYTPDGKEAVTHWGATENGIAIAREFGWLLEPNEGTAGAVSDMALERLNHYRFIGLVAAHYACPMTPIRSELGLDRVPLDRTVGEPQILADFAEMERQLKDAKKAGEPQEWGTLREAMLKKAIAEVKAGALEWRDLLEAYPLLRVLGVPGTKLGAGKNTASYHVPDLVIHRDTDRTGPKGKNTLVEVELSKKPWDDYKALWKLYNYERKHGYVYERIDYETDRQDIINLLHRVDKNTGYDLIGSGFVRIRTLTHLNGDPVKIKRRTRD